MNPRSCPDLKILVADDSPIYRKLVEQALCQESLTLLFAKNGRQAIELFTEHQPVLVITDWMMPDISGIELCQRIRAISGITMPTSSFSPATPTKSRVVQGLGAGADDYLTKPFHPGELQARVRVGRRIVNLHHEIQAKNRLLEEMAHTDSLTGLPNRRAIGVWTTSQLSAAFRHKFPIWMAMADLDHFKSINDTYGHDVGDAVLKRFAEILKSSIRASDLCGRLGGEEFVVVVTHVERENAAIAIERIRKRFEAERFKFGSRIFGATASFGVATFTGAAPPAFGELLIQADAALYAAKHGGRNCIEFAPG